MIVLPLICSAVLLLTAEPQHRNTATPQHRNTRVIPYPLRIKILIAGFRISPAKLGIMV